MLQFGSVYIGHRFVVFDVALEQQDGRWVYVATYSANPHVRKIGASPCTAAANLLLHLRRAWGMAPPARKHHKRYPVRA